MEIMLIILANILFRKKNTKKEYKNIQIILCIYHNIIYNIILMNGILQNRHYNHPILKLLQNKNCKYITSSGKYKIHPNYNMFTITLNCLLHNKINFIDKYNSFGVKEKKNVLNERIISYVKEKQIVSIESIKVIKIAELLDIKYLFIDNNAYIFYEEKKQIIIFFLYIRSIILKSSYSLKIQTLLYKFLFSKLQNFSKKDMYRFICNYFITNMPPKMEKEYNKWNLKQQNNTFSYKKDYNNRFKFIYLPQNKEFIDKEYNKIIKLGTNIYNKHINSQGFKDFYNKTIKLIKNFEYEDKKIMAILTPQNKKIVKKIIKDIENKFY